MSDDATVQVYWRPGCGSCQALRIAFAEAGVVAEWRNVWEDRAASGFVRSVAGGNETVPTLVIDGEPVVAPSPRRAVELVARADPHLVHRRGRWSRLRIVQWVSIIVLLGASEVVASAGHIGWSYALDGAAVGAYVVLRRLRGRSRFDASATAVDASSTA